MERRRPRLRQVAVSSWRQGHALGKWLIGYPASPMLVSFFYTLVTHEKHTNIIRRGFRNHTTSSNGRNRMKTLQGRLRAAVLMGAAASVMIFAAGGQAQDRNSNDNAWQHDDSGH